MNFKLDYLIKRYVSAYQEEVFVSTTKLEHDETKVFKLSKFNELNDFELQHKLEKHFLEFTYDVIDFENLNSKRQEVVIIAYIMAYSHIPYLLNEEIKIAAIKVLNCGVVNIKTLKNTTIFELLAKDLTNLPPNYLTPSDFYIFTQNIVQELGISELVRITAFDNDLIKTENFTLIDAIASSNNSENFVLELKFENSINAQTNHIFGKGVCYDSGGYSLKVNNSMRTMKGDMGGASNTLGIFLANVLNNGQNTTAYLGLVQNMISNPSLLPDQVIKTRDNILVEITNTDSEGRLVIADLIAYANDKIKTNDQLFVFATLTDIAKSMGRYVNTCFSNNLEFVNQISNVAQKNNEFIWALPLNQFENLYGKELEKASQIATIANSNLNNLEANSIYAANFGFYFVKNKTNNFIHFDIGSTGWRSGKGHAPLVRTISEFVK